MTEPRLITEEDTIFDIIQRHPELQQVLPTISEKFKRLNNPLVYNTVARVTTVKTAAGIGGIYLREMLYQINDAIGLGPVFLAEQKKQVGALKESFLQSRSGTTPQDRPDWMSQSPDWPVKDVRDSRQDPFEELSALAQNTPPGQGFILVQRFLPLPLLNYLKLQGFDSHVEKISDQEFHIAFYHSPKGKE